MESILTGQEATKLYKQDLTIALFQPEIPGNVGSIARSCVATDTALVIVGPIPFQITHSRLKRAGLDYWPHLRWCYLDTQKQFFEFFGKQRLVLTSVRGKSAYHEFQYKKGDILVFGRETQGLNEELMNNPKHESIHIPMWGQTRSLNIANSATTIMYEAYRRFGFPN
tara:strand:+ start:3412 stop:3915 length:504 start_codon:yes stop_codon:yes gene_type:complete